MQKKHIFIRHIILPLTAGSLFYYFFCPEVWLVQWIDRIIPLKRHSVSATDSFPGTFLRNYGMDMLWAYALTFALFVMLGRTEKNVRYTIILSAAMIVGTELLQLLQYCSGTFDVWDILAEASASGVAVVRIMGILKEK